jgi:hypothetical protein
VLKAVYEEASRRIAGRDIPTEPIMSSRTLYRSFDREYLKLSPDGIFRKQFADKSLIVRDQGLDVNRFTGQSFDAGIPARGGLYCSLQQQAQVNEVLHYARTEKSVPRDRTSGFPRADVALHRKCIVKIRLMGWLLAADLSPHNPVARNFIEDLGNADAVQDAFRGTGGVPRSTWDALNDGQDCSFARGLGLAVANSGHLQALQAGTVRQSERSSFESGDNLVLFGVDGKAVPNIWIEEAYVFPLKGEPQVIPVQF